MIRVAHVITGLEVGGAEMMLYKLLSGIDRSRFESRVLSLTGHGPIGARIEALGIPVVVLGALGVFSAARAAARLARELRGFRPDVVQTWLYHADLFGLFAKVWGVAPKLCWNLRCSDLGPGDAPPLTRVLARCLGMASRAPDIVIVNSQAGRLAHERIGYRPRRWEVIYNGFDAARFVPDPSARPALQESLNIPAQAPVIGMVARFDPMKDIDNFLHAVALLRTDRPAVHFILVGRGFGTDNRALVGTINHLRLAGQVHLLGECQDVPRIMAGFDIATLSSRSEGFPNVLGEAMACEVPCVATDVGDARELIGNTGYIVPARNPPALAQAWREATDMSPMRRRAMGEAARRRIAEHYSLDAAVTRYEVLYEELAGYVRNRGNS